MEHLIPFLLHHAVYQQSSIVYEFGAGASAVVAAGASTVVAAGASAVTSTVFFPYFLLNRSTRPAESRSFWRPVKNGWHCEQISTLILPTVERVSNWFPQIHVTTDFLYSG
jgi:hypothetical protein